MTTGAALKSRAFNLLPDTYFTRQDCLFDAAVEAVLTLGEEVLGRFPQLGAIETKANGRIDGCLMLWGINEEDNPQFLVIQAERATRWLIQKRYHVTVHWAIPDDAIAPVLRLCDPATAVTAGGPVRTEPLVVWLSKRLADKEVVGCKPGYFAQLRVADGQFQFAFFRAE